MPCLGVSWCFMEQEFFFVTEGGTFGHFKSQHKQLSGDIKFDKFIVFDFYEKYWTHFGICANLKPISLFSCE